MFWCIMLPFNYPLAFFSFFFFQFFPPLPSVVVLPKAFLASITISCLVLQKIFILCSIYIKKIKFIYVLFYMYLSSKIINSALAE